MKKLFFFAAAMLLMGVATSCKDGQCACRGINSDGSTINRAISQGGYTDDMACQDIKAQYPNAQYLDCRPGKTEETYDN